ncbi:hypothetical protein GCM10010304_82600 [Streptomyces roseoviolaceus]
MPGNRSDCKAWEESGAKAAVGAIPQPNADLAHQLEDLSPPTTEALHLNAASSTSRLAGH